MGGSHNIQAKFTNEEMKEIRRYMQKHKIKNESRLVRHAVEDMMGLSILNPNRKPLLPTAYISVYHFYEGYLKQLADLPEQKQNFEHFFEKWKREFFNSWTPKYNQKLSKAWKIRPAFREHKKVGRPKQKKRLRGRPRNTGHDD